MRCDRRCKRPDCKFKHPDQQKKNKKKQEQKDKPAKGVVVGKPVHVCTRTPFIQDGVATVTAVDKDGIISVRFPDGAVYQNIQPGEYVLAEDKSVDHYSKRMAYRLIERLHQHMTAQGHVLEDIIAQFDEDGDGYVSEEELVKGMASITGEDPSHWRKAMDAIDTDGDRRISIHELDKSLHEAHSESAQTHAESNRSAARMRADNLLFQQPLGQ